VAIIADQDLCRFFNPPPWCLSFRYLLVTPPLDQPFKRFSRAPNFRRVYQGWTFFPGSGFLRTKPPSRPLLRLSRLVSPFFFLSYNTRYTVWPKRPDPAGLPYAPVCPHSDATCLRLYTIDCGTTWFAECTCPPCFFFPALGLAQSLCLGCPDFCTLPLSGFFHLVPVTSTGATHFLTFLQSASCLSGSPLFPFVSELFDPLCYMNVSRLVPPRGFRQTALLFSFKRSSHGSGFLAAS